MNYQYIEQLIERYFNCQTTLQEEQILRSFFAQEDVPGHLMQYAELFQYEIECKAEETLGCDFDEKMLALIDEENTARVIPLKTQGSHLAPFFRAAAVVAIALTVGLAADNALNDQPKASKEGVTTINPYIKQADIPNVIRIKDVSQAEAKPQTDSLLAQPVENTLQ